MQVIRFVHAADLHLDTAFPGISREAPADLVKKLHESTFTAFARLIALCERECPDFLLIAGDIHNFEDRSVRAQLTLRDGCERLRQKGIRVFIAHGNHDPLSSRMQNIRWPENVTVFSEELASVPLFRGEATWGQEPLALVHGLSHATAREHRNLALRFKRSEEKCFQVGLLHCSITGMGGDKGRYAPCTLEDLKSVGLDYWALGHIHERRELCASPTIVYPGCAQGLHINEQGEKGCMLVTASPDGGGGYTLESSFRPLGPVIWRVLDVPLDAALDVPLDAALDGLRNASQNAPLDFIPEAPSFSPPPGACAQAGDGSETDENGETGENGENGDALSLDALENRLRTALDAVADEQGPDCEALIVRLRLTGRSGLDALLRREPSRAELLARLRDWEPGNAGHGSEGGPRTWVKDLEIRTRPLLERRILAEREDLLGEIIRLAEACRTSPERLAQVRAGALAPLFGHSRIGKALAPLSDEEVLALLDDAESLCLDLLEDE